MTFRINNKTHIPAERHKDTPMRPSYDSNFQGFSARVRLHGGIRTAFQMNHSYIHAGILLYSKLKHQKNTVSARKHTVAFIILSTLLKETILSTWQSLSAATPVLKHFS